MHLEVPDDIVLRAEIGASDLRLAIALQLYADNMIDHGDACRLADITPERFNRELISRRLSVQQYSTERRVRIRSVR